MFTLERGGIIITQQFEEKSLELQQALLPLRSVRFICDDFKIEEAREVIAEAYKSEENVKTLILGAKNFTVYAQNTLLKILEEPPANIIFILLAPSKSIFLPTVRSRMSLHIEAQAQVYSAVNIRLQTLDLKGLFQWVKENDKLKSHEAKALIERLFYHAVHIEKLVLNNAQVEGFEKAFRLLTLNGRTQTVLVMLLMNFLKEVKRAR